MVTIAQEEQRLKRQLRPDETQEIQQTGSKLTSTVNKPATVQQTKQRFADVYKQTG